MTSKRRASTLEEPPNSAKVFRSSATPPPNTSTSTSTAPSSNLKSTSFASASTFSSTLIHTCTLPPTCQPPIGQATFLRDASALERHYATYHTHVCEEGSCRCVFPEARFLELHQTECHDPLAAVRKDRGEKIFACFVSDCSRRFSTPKTRRLHLVQGHAFPKQYFFGIVNRGIGGLLREYGEGASLIRPDWKARSPDSKMDSDSDVDEGKGGDADKDMDDDDEDEDEETKPIPNSKDKPSTKPTSAPTATSTSAAAAAKIAKPAKTEKTSALREAPPHLRPPTSTSTSISSTTQSDAKAGDIDALAAGMDALNLIPSNFRFGRGAHGGFHSMGGARGTGSGSARGRGRGRDRGRGGRKGSIEGGGGSEVDKSEIHKMALAREKEKDRAEVVAFVPKQVRAKVVAVATDGMSIK